MHADCRGESGSLRACVVAISWPAYTTHGLHARARATPRWGPAAPLRRSGDFSGRFTVSVARNDSASVRRRDRRLARLAKVALKFTPPTAEDSPRRSVSLATPHYCISSDGASAVIMPVITVARDCGPRAHADRSALRALRTSHVVTCARGTYPRKWPLINTSIHAGLAMERNCGDLAARTHRYAASSSLRIEAFSSRSRRAGGASERAAT